MAAAVATSKWKTRRRRVYQSVFQTDISQPTPYSTPSVRFIEQGQPFGGHLPLSSLDHHLHHASHTLAASVDGTPGSTADILYQQHVGASSPYTPTIAASFASPQQIPSAGHLGQQDAAQDQMRYDRAWHVVTSRIALPASATAEDSFGTLAPESQYQSQGQRGSSEAQFYEALRLVLNAPTVLPRAAHTEDILFWHTQQVRRHFAQHVLPLLSACASGLLDEEDLRSPTGRGSYEKHMIVVMSSVRTLEAAMRLYSYGLQLLVRGIQRVQGVDKENAAADPELIAGRFRRDVHSLVSNSASPQLTRSLRVVLVHLVGTILGVPAQQSGEKGEARIARSAPPSDNDLNALAARKRLLELLDPLYSVGLAGESFQILFAEVMDGMMCDFVKGAYAGVWAAPSEKHGLLRSTSITGLQATNSGGSSPCIVSLCNWVENHYARLAIQVLSRVSEDPSRSAITLSDVKTYQSLALGRLAALRISELFDIVLAWPSSRGALDDLRAAITTPARRLQLTDSFATQLQRRLLHPGRSTLEILQTYIAMIRTFHVLDHSKVLLSRVSPSLQLYLCGREDAVRIVVTGLLASSEEIRAARMEKQMREENEGSARGRTQPRTPQGGMFMTPALPSRRGLRSRQGTPDVEEAGIRDAPKTSTPNAGARGSTKLVELALLMSDPIQSRRAGGADEDADLDWNDMSWVPDPIDAGANYKRPRSEDVIGTLISALGSPDTFIREFQVIVAERLLSDQARFEQEVRVLSLLKKRFGEAALQNCDVMIRDIQDSRRLDGAIRKVQSVKDGAEQSRAPQPAATPTNPKTRSRTALSPSTADDGAPYHARILSRLFWPNLDREHFLLPTPIQDQQKHYEQGYEHLKASRKLTWLNQLGQATVELELQDRTVAVDCKTYEATVIYAFQSSDSTPARRTVSDLEEQLQMDDDLIFSALAFWVSKGVLARRGDVYTVLETAPSSSDQTASNPPSPDPAAAAADAEPAAPTAIAMDEKEVQRRTMYWQYIRGMLTNAAASMPLGQMAMMMKMLIADGFPWSNEELQEFLAEKVGDGELEIVGGKYKLVKK